MGRTPRLTSPVIPGFRETLCYLGARSRGKGPSMRHTCTSRVSALFIALACAGAARPSGAASIADMDPSANNNGTRGLGQIVSAEPMGQGRLTVTARGNLYLQAKDFPGAPAKDAQISTGTFGLGFGANPYMDVFAAANIYNVAN